MSFMKSLIDKAIKNSSPAEIEHIKRGCLETAQWLVEHTIEGLTESQSESVALNVVLYFKQ